MPDPKTNQDDAAAIGLSALAWTLAEPTRAERLLALTGLTPADLRERAGEPALLVAVLSFLEAHEPDLLGCAAALDLSAVALIGARTRLEA